MTEIDSRIAVWQASRQVIGMIEFLPPETVADKFPFYELPTDAIFLGVMEADALCLMDDGGIQVFDHEVKGRIFCKAAPNQAILIEALNVLEEHFERCGEDDDYVEDESAAALVQERCTAIAGGEDYASFYCSLVGA